MKILDDLLARVETVEVGLASGQTIKFVVEKHEKDILDLQKEQLFEGKASSGEDLRPYYSEDIGANGYFRTAEGAANYAAWKERIPYPYTAQRNPDAPNLYINGKFHSTLKVEFDSNEVTVNGSDIWSMRIVNKYGLGSFGLMAEKWNELFRDKGAYDELLNEVKTQIYGN